jgi:hypothetical protein
MTLNSNLDLFLIINITIFYTSLIRHAIDLALLKLSLHGEQS